MKKNIPLPKNERIDELLTINLPFLAECVITAQYFENHILDGKYDINSNSNLFRTIMYEYIFENFNDKKSIVSSYVHRMMKYVTLG